MEGDSILTHPEYPSQIDTQVGLADEPVTLGHRLRALRLKAGLSQKGLAAGICSRTYVARIEADSRFPGAQMLSRFSRRLGVSLTSLLPYYLSSSMVGPRQCLSMARELAARGEVDAARRSLEKAKELLAGEDPSHPLFYIADETEGLIYYGAGDFSKAAALLEAAIKNEKEAPSGHSLGSARLSLGLALLRGKDHPGAAASLVRALAEVVMMERASQDHGEHGGREEIFFKIIQGLMQTALEISEPGLALLIYDFAGGYMEVTGASRSMPRIIKLYRAEANLRMGNFDDARKSLERLCQSGSWDIAAHAHLNLGVLGRLREDWITAEHHLTTAWHIWSRWKQGNPMVTAQELAWLYIGRSSPAEAEKWIEKALTLGDGADPIAVADLYLLRARLARLKGNYDEALDLLAPALKRYREARNFQGGKQLARIEALKIAIEKGNMRDALDVLAHIEKDIELKTL